MSKKILITAIVIILIAGVAVWKIGSNKLSDNASKNTLKASNEASGTNKANDSTNNDTNSKDLDKNNSENNSESNNSNDNNSTDVSSISGFNSEKASGSKSGNDNSNSSNNSDSKSDKDNNNRSSNKISLPYTIASTGMKITNIGKYSGDFVEDGSDKNVSNVLSIVVTNTSSKDLQYGEIKLRAGGKTATFKLTNVPSGKSVLVLETNGMKYSSGANYKYAEATYAQIDMPMNSDKVKVSTNDSKITIKNTSGKDLGTVYVYYKNLDKSGAYLGGITYRVKFENVKKGDTLSQTTKHFSKSNSKIVMVDTEK